jgi:hypothetical protein
VSIGSWSSPFIEFIGFGGRPAGHPRSFAGLYGLPGAIVFESVSSAHLFSVVVASATNVPVEQQLAGLAGRRRLRLAIEAVLEDRIDAAVGASAGRERPRARRFDPLATVATLEPQDPQAGAVALLGMRPLGEESSR